MKIIILKKQINYEINGNIDLIIYRNIIMNYVNHMKSLLILKKNNILKYKNISQLKNNKQYNQNSAVKFIN